MGGHDIDDELTESERAVRKVFAILGVDIDKPDQIEEFREDLRFGRKMRRVADHSTLALAGLLVLGLGAAVWAGIISLVSKGGH